MVRRVGNTRPLWAEEHVRRFCVANPWEIMSSHFNDKTSEDISTYDMSMGLALGGIEDVLFHCRMRYPPGIFSFIGIWRILSTASLRKRRLVIQYYDLAINWKRFVLISLKNDRSIHDLSEHASYGEAWLWCGREEDAVPAAGGAKSTAAGLGRSCGRGTGGGKGEFALTFIIVADGRTGFRPSRRRLGAR